MNISESFVVFYEQNSWLQELVLNMRAFRKSFSISSSLLRSSTIHRPFSSSSSSNLSPELKTLLPSSHPSISQPISTTSTSDEFPHLGDLKNANLQIPISQNLQNSSDVSEPHVLSVLLSLKELPVYALVLMEGLNLFVSCFIFW
ncbi:UBX domain-containing protein 1-A [Bienertia sinuspersici]